MNNFKINNFVVLIRNTSIDYFMEINLVFLSMNISPSKRWGFLLWLKINFNTFLHKCVFIPFALRYLPVFPSMVNAIIVKYIKSYNWFRLVYRNAIDFCMLIFILKKKPLLIFDFSAGFSNVFFKKLISSFMKVISKYLLNIFFHCFLVYSIPCYWYKCHSFIENLLFLSDSYEILFFVLHVLQFHYVSNHRMVNCSHNHPSWWVVSLHHL